MYLKTEKDPRNASHERFARWLIKQLDEAHGELLDCRTDAELMTTFASLSQSVIRKADRVLSKFGL